MMTARRCSHAARPPLIYLSCVCVCRKRAAGAPSRPRRWGEWAWAFAQLTAEVAAPANQPGKRRDEPSRVFRWADGGVRPRARVGTEERDTAYVV
eukprot:scaffold1687_cov405-Prasinococcus_capsulatus_cf.AAC.39